MTKRTKRVYKLDPAAEAMIGTHEFECDQAEDLTTGEVRPTTGKLTVTITRELMIKARMLGWSGRQVFAEAMRLSVPEATDIDFDGAKPPRAN